MSRTPRCALSPLEEGVQRLEADAAHYLLRVHRLGQGDRFVAFDPAERLEADATVLSRDARRAECRIEALRPASLVSSLPLVLLQAIGKGDKIDRVVRDATQLGVQRIVLVESARSVPRVADKHRDKQQRYQRIALEAARQSGRGDVPEVLGPHSLCEALELTEQAVRKLLFDTQSETPVRVALARAPGTAVAALVGPEGGFEAAERQSAVAAGFCPVSLSRFTLRTETAAIAALAVIAEHC